MDKPIPYIGKKKPISRYTRKEIIEVLESYGVACYDDETTKELRECLVDTMKDSGVTHIEELKYGLRDKFGRDR